MKYTDDEFYVFVFLSIAIPAIIFLLAGAIVGIILSI
jgi:uncharacterized integral membrane protein